MRGDIMLDIDFLSRLCGGECAEMLVRVFSDFLSRLCGGE